MNATGNTARQSPSDYRQCRRCKAILPIYARFCGTCGVPVEKISDNLSTHDSPDISKLYRITSLVRRRSYVQLFFAVDNVHRRPVVIRDINISSLDEEQRTLAIEATQHEYDLLSSQRSDDMMPVIDWHYSQGHLFVVAGIPFTISSQNEDSAVCYSLQDLLQSGVGLPDQHVAITWAYRLCCALAHLHHRQIILGDLDPHAIMVRDNNYSGTPALMVSWLPVPIRNLLPRTSVITNANCFSAPEVLLNRIEPHSDIYSLGAILYLLLTGTSPEEPILHIHRSLRSPREINPRISSRIEEVVMHALSVDSADRYQSADEMSEVLLELCFNKQSARSETLTSQGREGKQSMSERVARKEVQKRSTVTDGSDEMTISVGPGVIQLAWRHLFKQTSGQFGVNNGRYRVSIVDTLKQDEQKKASHDQEEQRQDKNNMKNFEEHQEERESEETLEHLAISVLSPLPEEAPMNEPFLEPVAVSTPLGSGETAVSPPQEIPVLEPVAVSTLSGSEETAVFSPPQEILALEPVAVSTPLGSEEAAVFSPPQKILVLKPVAVSPPQEIPVLEPAVSAPLMSEETAVSPLQEIPVLEPAAVSTPPESLETIASPPEEVQNHGSLPAPVVVSTQLQPQETTQEARIFEERVSSVLPALRPSGTVGTATSVSPSEQMVTNDEKSFFKQLQRFFLGEQQRNTKAVALIETPLRIRPKQNYVVRIHLLGRDVPVPSPDTKEDTPLAGLSALVQGDLVHIEIRSALYKSYAYIVQQADVRIPEHGYAAEVTMPMQSLLRGSTGRRDRLHLFFTDGARRPLYEKPFVIELFVSPLVRFGQEGHNVLAIPL